MAKGSKKSAKQDVKKAAKGGKKAAEKAVPEKLAAGDETQLVDLTKEENKQLANPRDGYEQHIDPVLDGYVKFEKELYIPGFDPAKVKKDFAKAKDLEAKAKATAKQAEMQAETARLLRSGGWRGMLNVYRRAQSASATNKDIARAFADFKEFMKKAPAAKKSPKGGKGGGKGGAGGSGTP